MKKIPYDPRELEITGKYPGGTIMFGVPDGAPKYARPITPKENLRLALTGQTPCWIPFAGMGGGDVHNFRPRIHPDSVATHLVIDGGEPITYESNSITSDWYDLIWDFVPSVGGATVRPGSPKVPDITQWEKYISIPNLDNMDWDGCSRDNQEYCNVDKPVELCILSGWWERLISLMDVENAAVALIDEEQQEGVHRFLDQHTKLLIDYVDRMIRILPIDMVLVHDDWGHQNGPFFAPETGAKMIVPYLKRMVDFCHSKGLLFELHCCGRNETNVPNMIAAGVDLWCGQGELNDYEELSEKYKDANITFGFCPLSFDPDATEEDLREAGRQWVIRHRNHHVALTLRNIPEVFSNAVYEYSRRLNSGEEI